VLPSGILGSSASAATAAAPVVVPNAWPNPLMLLLLLLHRDPGHMLLLPVLHCTHHIDSRWQCALSLMSRALPM
jgi:hypothetical protein